MPPPACISVIPGMSAVYWYEPEPPAEMMRHLRPAASTASRACSSLANRLSDRCALLGRVGDEQGMALVSHQSVEP